MKRRYTKGIATGPRCITIALADGRPAHTDWPVFGNECRRIRLDGSECAGRRIDRGLGGEIHDIAAQDFRREQQTHGYMQTIAFNVIASLACLHREHFRGLVGLGPEKPDFSCGSRAASSVERLRCDRGKYGHDFRLAQYGVAIGPSKMGSPGAIFRTVLGNFMLRSRQGSRIAASKF